MLADVPADLHQWKDYLRCDALITISDFHIMDPDVVTRDVNTIKATNERAAKHEIVDFCIRAQLYDQIVTRS